MDYVEQSKVGQGSTGAIKVEVHEASRDYIQCIKNTTQKPTETIEDFKKYEQLASVTLS